MIFKVAVVKFACINKAKWETQNFTQINGEYFDSFKKAPADPPIQILSKGSQILFRIISENKFFWNLPLLLVVGMIFGKKKTTQNEQQIVLVCFKMIQVIPAP